MARRQRFHTPNSTYHIMLRGNNGQDIFFSDKDRCRLCLLLQQSAERCGLIIEAYCFMKNHIHLAIRAAEAGLSKFIHYLAFRYARYVNRKYNRIGHLFQGRFRSILVEDTAYLKELIRYIHLNPVRANIVSTPENYLWSSHRSYLGLTEVAWLSQERVLNKFHDTPADAINNFNKYVLNGIGIESPYDFKSGSMNGILGNENFIVETLATTSIIPAQKIELSDLINKICAKNNLSLHEFCSKGKALKLSHARGLASFFVREIEGLTLEQLGKFMSRDPSGLSKLANRLQIKSYNDSILANQIQEMRKWIFEPANNHSVEMSGCQA